MARTCPRPMRIVIVVLAATLAIATRAAAAPPWFDGTNNRGTSFDISDFYQHQKWGKTPVPADLDSQNDSSWEFITGKWGGWCRRASIANGLYYWKKKRCVGGTNLGATCSAASACPGGTCSNYDGLFADGVTANATWLPVANATVQSLATTPKTIPDILKDRGHGAEKGVGPGKGLAYSKYFSARDRGIASDLIGYTSSDGNTHVLTKKLFDLYAQELKDGNNVQVIFRTPRAGLPAGDGGITYDSSLWWSAARVCYKGTNHNLDCYHNSQCPGGECINHGAYHNVTGAGVDIPNKQIFFADPDSNKGNAKANAGIDTTKRPEPAVNGRKYILWNGTNDAVPVPARGAAATDEPPTLAQFYLKAVIATDGRTIDATKRCVGGNIGAACTVASECPSGTCYDNERYKRVAISELEIIGPIKAAPKPASCGVGACTFEVTANDEPLSAFWLFPAAPLDFSAPATFTRAGWMVTKVSIDQEGDSRPDGGLKVENISGSNLVEGEIEELSFSTLSLFTAYDFIARSANDPTAFGIQVVGVDGEAFPDQTASTPDNYIPVSGKKLQLKDSATTTKRRLLFQSKDPTIVTLGPFAMDPVTNGATLQIFNSATSESVCLNLPNVGGAWQTRGVPPNVVYKYKDKSFVNGPCKVALIKNGLAKVTCMAKVQPIAYSLDEPAQGAVNVWFTSGDITYCTSFGGTVTADSGTNPPNVGGKGKFNAKDVPVPNGCPLPPVICP